MSITQQSKPSLFTTSILMKNSWFDSRNLMKKNDKIASFFKSRTKLRLKKTRGPT